MEATITLRKDILNETYRDVENLIYSIVWKFQKRHGGDFEELNAEANLLFIKANDSFNKSKANFSTWLNFTIWYGLLDFQNMLRETNKYAYKEYIEESNLPISKEMISTNPLIDLLDEMNDDCKIMTNLILEDIIEFPDTITKAKSTRNFRASLKRHLKDKLHWTGRRIKESFIEMERIVQYG